MPYSYNKLRGKIKEVFGSQENFAKEIGISNTSLSKKLNCKSGISQSDIKKWSELLSIDSDDYGAYFFT